MKAEGKSSALPQTAATVQFWSSDKRLMLSNKEDCIHLNHTNISDATDRLIEENTVGLRGEASVTVIDYPAS